MLYSVKEEVDTTYVKRVRVLLYSGKEEADTYICEAPKGVACCTQLRKRLMHM